jgi:hypothetical protein
VHARRLGEEIVEVPSAVGAIAIDAVEPERPAAEPVAAELDQPENEETPENVETAADPETAPAPASRKTSRRSTRGRKEGTDE